MLKQLVNLLFGMIQISTNNQEITLNYLSCPLIMQGTSIILPINGIIRQITLIHIPLRNVCLDVHFVYSLDIHTAEPHCDDVEEPDEFISKSLRIRFVVPYYLIGMSVLLMERSGSYTYSYDRLNIGK